MAFQQALSGLNTAASAIDVTSNNIANAGTVGFKVSRTQFADSFAASLQNTGGSSIGIGANVANVAQQFTQGNITSTKNPLDVAISGAGFFRMSSVDGAISYSRNGQFSVDSSGLMVNNQGLRLNGYGADDSGEIIEDTPGPIYVNPGDLQPTATGTSTGLSGFQGVRANFNLDSRLQAPPNAWAPVVTNGLSTVSPLEYNFSSTVTLYDSLGNPHTMSMYFVKQAVPAVPNTSDWDVHMIVDGTQETNVLFDGAPGPRRLTFDSTGSLDEVATPADWEIQVDLNAVTTDLQLADPTVPNNAASQILGVQPAAATPPSLGGFQFDVSGTSSYGSSNGVNRLEQDGFSSGRLTGVGISDDGILVGRYTNGQTRNLGQIILANFTNPNGLKPVGDGQWLESTVSGPPTIGAPGSSSLGVLQASAIEESNVDLTEELVSMIVQQRAYQANAQSIKTQDSILNTIVNLR